MAGHRAAAYVFTVALALGVLASIPAGNPDFSLAVVRASAIIPFSKK
jgi:hypothetical protein